MTMNVILKHYCKIMMTFVTTIETSRHSRSKSSKLKKVFVLQSWDLSLNGEIILTLEIFKNSRKKEKELF